MPLCQLKLLYSRLRNMFSEQANNSALRMSETADLLQSFPTAGFGTRTVAKTLGALSRLAVPIWKPWLRMIEEHYDNPVPLWIDTFCVPIDKGYRQLAVSWMRQVHSNAYYTVVLDSELQHFNARSCPKEEICLRVGVSGWMRRAWTFQEGALSG
jgi:hypothetical protein